MANYDSGHWENGQWHKHTRRERIAIRVGGAIGATILGGLDAILSWAWATSGPVNEVITTNTTTTTIINGVKHVTTNSQTIDYSGWGPVAVIAGMVMIGLLFLGCLVVTIWPDQA